MLEKERLRLVPFIVHQGFSVTVEKNDLSLV